ncbi:hypothetical protein [Zavarzinia compransoris]|uniref:Uncharacterized protein n=1 Tax=Zavarzinia compransoris TaxID=1264899 RepID=A0A317E1S1_9PROT|nr:hypothetical protein [Zavarzinia compransoris]PWR21028.1 hypothetical protein DKG75_13655 [Zavarzinia compransoris]TDP44060.1 hypothetical protein DES42_108107 [Zavarzinia compransoris]
MNVLLYSIILSASGQIADFRTEGSFLFRHQCEAELHRSRLKDLETAVSQGVMLRIAPTAYALGSNGVLHYVYIKGCGDGADADRQRILSAITGMEGATLARRAAAAVKARDGGP